MTRRISATLLSTPLSRSNRDCVAWAMILGERGLPDPWRPEEDDRRDAVRLDGPSQELARAEDVLLAGILIQRARTHPRRKRRSRGHGGCLGCGIRKEVGHCRTYPAPARREIRNPHFPPIPRA